jgi:hypothetical protein
LSGLGLSVVMQRDHRRARALLSEALHLHREQGLARGVATTLYNLGRLSCDEEDPLQAWTHLSESLILRQATGAKLGIAECLEGLGLADWPEGHAARASTLLGAAHALRDTIGAPLPPGERPAHDRVMAALRAAAGEEFVATAWATGQTLPLASAIADALSVAPAGARQGRDH